MEVAGVTTGSLKRELRRLQAPDSVRAWWDQRTSCDFPYRKPHTLPMVVARGRIVRGSVRLQCTWAKFGSIASGCFRQ